MRTASSAPQRNVSMRREVSPRESLIGLPASTHNACAISSKRSWKRFTQCISTSCRLYGGNFRIASCASTAAWMPASIALGSACATRVATSPEYLSVTSRSSLAKTASFAR